MYIFSNIPIPTRLNQPALGNIENILLFCGFLICDNNNL
ncbi:hypothetical protein BGAPBR_E0015 (plasmid) [Borreliella garinii PBr]|uniref:Uncharacterized protein n=1 Tax=Borreliella garinii PBr TaxID=498743 RepID=B8F0J5_BORGR|nr:hypothetical protein BGAPBR_E0015 [Borreliella garinii PBr]